MLKITKSRYPKLIYFAQRHSDYNYRDFIQRWRKHAQLGISMPRWENIYKYSHCDSFIEDEHSINTFNCDGVALVWYKNENARKRHVLDLKARKVMQEDEKKTFFNPVRNVSLLTNEHIFQRSKSLNFKFFLCVWKKTKADIKEIQNFWKTIISDDLVKSLKIKYKKFGYIQNHVKLPIETKNLFNDCICVDEINCMDIQLADLLTSKIKSFLSLNKCLDKIDILCTNEKVLYNLEVN